MIRLICEVAHFSSCFAADYDFSGGTVCAMSNSTNIGQPFVFSPRDRTENGSYTVTRINGLSFKVCVFNNGIDLSVTNLNGSGTFNVTFISQEGRSVTLPVDYGTCIRLLADHGCCTSLKLYTHNYIKMQFEVYAAMHVASLEYSLYIAVYAVLA